MIPWLIAGAVGALVASEVMDDNKKELQTSKSREQVSASEVPEEIRKQIEGQTKNLSPMESAQEIYDMANNYYYGLNGYKQDKSKAKGLYYKAADKGLWKAKSQLKNIWSIDY